MHAAKSAGKCTAVLENRHRACYNEPMITLNQYCRQQFGEKLYKLTLNGGMTCPNRDGTLDTRGCIFCSAGGSGEFAPPPSLDMDAQIEAAKARVAQKYRGSRYIAYFQAYTNTYATVDRLEELFLPVIQRDDIAALSIATRPDCLGPEILRLLARLRRIKPVWVELGLQTMHDSTARYIRRGFPTEVYDEAVRALNALDIHTVTHVILGLPGESRQDMLDTVRHVGEAGSRGIKLQLLQVLRGTDLADEYAAGKFSVMEMDEYIALLKDCIGLLPPDTVVHRLTGDGPKKLLIAPVWCADKKRVLNALHKEGLGL